MSCLISCTPPALASIAENLTTAFRSNRSDRVRVQQIRIRIRLFKISAALIGDRWSYQRLFDRVDASSATNERTYQQIRSSCPPLEEPIRLCKCVYCPSTFSGVYQRFYSQNIQQSSRTRSKPANTNLMFKLDCVPKSYCGLRRVRAGGEGGSHLQSVETVETGTRVLCVRKARPRNGCGVGSGGKKLAERSQRGVAEWRQDGKANLTHLPGVPAPSDTINTFILCPFSSRGEASEACLCSEGRILNSLLEGRNFFSRQHRGSLRIKQQQVLSAGSTLRSKETPKLSSMPASTKSNPPEEWSPNNAFSIGGSPLSEEKAWVTDSWRTS